MQKKNAITEFNELCNYPAFPIKHVAEMLSQASTAAYQYVIELIVEPIYKVICEIIPSKFRDFSNNLRNSVSSETGYVSMHF